VKTQREPTIHERFVQVFRNKAGRTFSTAEIHRLMKIQFSHMPSGSILPNDHGNGNKTPCDCSGTDHQIFNRIARATYVVRDFR